MGSWSAYVEAALPLAVIAFVLTMSQVKQFASENRYSASANQELFALGVMNIVSSFFSAYVPASSLARSVVANKIKPRSQLWALVSVAIIAVCIGGLAPLLHDLPSSVLAAIIIAAFKTLLMQITEPIRLWKVSKREAILWVAVFLIALLLTTQWAIVAALALSVGSLIGDVSRPNFSFLGRLGDSKIYRDTTRYPAARSPPEVLIFRFDAHLHFANHEFFGEALSAGIARKLAAQEEERMEWALRDDPDQAVTLEVVSPKPKRREGADAAPSSSPLAVSPARAGAAEVAIEMGSLSAASPGRPNGAGSVLPPPPESLRGVNEETSDSGSDEDGSDEDGVMLRVRVDRTAASAPRGVPGPLALYGSGSHSPLTVPAAGPDRSERKSGAAGRRADGPAGDGLPAGGPELVRGESEGDSRDADEQVDGETEEDAGAGRRTVSPSSAGSAGGSERQPLREGWSLGNLSREMRVRWKRELNPKLRLAVVISAFGINSVDSSSMETLRRLSEREDLLLLFVGLKASIRSMLVKHSGILHVQYAMFHDLHDAVVFGRACVLHQRKIREQEAAPAEAAAEEGVAAGGAEGGAGLDTETSVLSDAPESED